MVETDFQRDLKKGLSAQGFWLFKIPDSAMGIVKPCDMVGCWRGVHVSMEAKLHKIENITASSVILDSGDFKRREHQPIHLREICTMGGLGVIALGVYQTQAPWNKVAFLLRIDKWNGGRLTVGDAMKIGAYMNYNSGLGWTVDLDVVENRKALYERPR